MTKDKRTASPGESRWPLLDRVQTTADLRGLSFEELKSLCEEIRRYLLEVMSQTGGHVASNLGAVELTVALERCFDTERDRLVFDVGHQCYTHKLLTGRKEQMQSLRQEAGISGFPKPSESESDAFIAGHCSNSVSVALGMARAQMAKPEKERDRVIALIGDGSMSGGLAYEGMNDAGTAGLPLIVILNDNGMSIGRSVGALSRMLNNFRVRTRYLRAKRTYHRVMNRIPGGKVLNRTFTAIKNSVKHSIIPGKFFEIMGFTYIGPVNGHDVEQLCYILEQAKLFTKPVLIHVLTQKGKGYPFAERAPENFHGMGAFDLDSGMPRKSGGETFSSVFGQTLCTLAGEDPRVAAVTAAMQHGVGLQNFARRFPDRFYDVGIAEEHAVAMAAGLAAGGMRPFFAVYSTFLQRAYDQLLHDVGLMSLPVTFCVDRCGFVGEDGETHQGLYDLAILKSVPKMEIYAPTNAEELATMLRRSLHSNGPVAVRYPRGACGKFAEDTAVEDTVILEESDNVMILTYGITVDAALEAATQCREKGLSVGVCKLNRIHPLPIEQLRELKAKVLLVAEEAAAQGSVGQGVAEALCNSPVQVICINCGQEYVAQASCKRQAERYGLDSASLAEKAAEYAR